MEPQTIVTVNRLDFTEQATLGELLVNGIFLCNTLEDTCRRDANNDGFLQAAEKIFEKTAIPSGRYGMRLDVSGRFGFCPFLLDVPYFQDVRLHWGNTSVDTKGCILVGKRDVKAPNFISDSRVSFANLMRRLIPLEPRGLILDVKGGLPPDPYRV